MRHDLPPGPLTLYALFARRPYHVRQVEAAVAGRRGGLRGLDGVLWSEPLEVVP